MDVSFLIPRYYVLNTVICEYFACEMIAFDSLRLLKMLTTHELRSVKDTVGSDKIGIGFILF